MLKNLTGLREYPFVKQLLAGSLTSTNVRKFRSNLHEFLKGEDFRADFGFERSHYTSNEVVSIIRQIIFGGKYIEYDSGTLTELESQKHQFDLEIDNTLVRIGQIISDRTFQYIAPLIILVRKEKLASWEHEKDKIKMRLNPYFKDLDNEDMMNFCSGIYVVKNKELTLGLSVGDDRLASIPAVINIPDRGTINHETLHFIKHIFYTEPQGETGGLTDFFAGADPSIFSLFSAEFLPYLIQYGDMKMYKLHLHDQKKPYRFAYPPKIDREYDENLDKFADEVKSFIISNPDGLLSLIAFYPVYRHEIDKTAYWTLFDVPEDPQKDLFQFKQYLIRYGYNTRTGIPRTSGLASFIRDRYKQYTKTWYEVYKKRKNF